MMPNAASPARRLSALAASALAFVAVSGAASAQTSYREYEDGPRDAWTDEESDDRFVERPPPPPEAPGDAYGEERFVPDDGGPDDFGPDDSGPDDFGDADGFDQREDLQADRSPGHRGSLKDGDVDDVSYFYEELENDGRWFEHDDYGYVWRPARIDADWRPYTRGRWALTDAYGWFWVSDEPFGWATYHYGRWFHDRRHGWVWVPGTRWGPAWVAWRDSDSFIGWAPLPPHARWEGSRHAVVWREDLYEDPAFAIYWSFLAPAYFTVSDPWRYYAPRHRVPHLVRHSRPHTHYAWRNRAIYNRGIAVERIERAIRRPVPRHHATFRTVRPAPHARGGLSGGRFEVYRPDLTRRAMNARPRSRDIPGAAPGAGRAWRDVDRRPAHVEIGPSERPRVRNERRERSRTWTRRPDAWGSRYAPEAGRVHRNPRAAARERSVPQRGKEASRTRPDGGAQDGRTSWRPDLGKRRDPDKRDLGKRAPEARQQPDTPQGRGGDPRRPLPLPL